jgi:hypothetical protein
MDDGPKYTSRRDPRAPADFYCFPVEQLGAPGILPRGLNAPCGASVVTARTPSPTERRIPMKLADTQFVLLSAASQREDGAVVLGLISRTGQPGKWSASCCVMAYSKKSRPPRRCRLGAVTMTRGRGRCALHNEVSFPRIISARSDDAIRTRWCGDDGPRSLDGTS